MTFYDRKLVRMTAVTPKGDDVKLQLPVAAVKRLIDQAGKDVYKRQGHILQTITLVSQSLPLIGVRQSRLFWKVT